MHNVPELHILQNIVYVDFNVVLVTGQLVTRVDLYPTIYMCLVTPWPLKSFDINFDFFHDTIKAVVQSKFFIDVEL